MIRITKTIWLSMVLACLLLQTSVLAFQNNVGIDPDALIERILMVEAEQYNAIDDVTFDVTSMEGEMKDNEGFVEKERFDKKIYLKHLPDTVLYYEEYLAYYKDGEQKEEKDLRKAEKDRREKRKKRKAMDISYRMVTPFMPEHRDQYEIKYLGVSAEPIEGYLSHTFQVTAKEEAEGLINGTFYFDAESFHLVRVDFSPAKLVKKTMFKLKSLAMSMICEPTPDGYWFPSTFEIEGKGKAAFFIGVSFAGREYYRNPTINSSVDQSLFEVADND